MSSRVVSFFSAVYIFLRFYRFTFIFISDVVIVRMFIRFWKSRVGLGEKQYYYQRLVLVQSFETWVFSVN